MCSFGAMPFLTNRMSKKEFGLIFWLHSLIIISAFFSFLYIDWKIIFWGVVFLQAYYSLRGGCDLTLIEFGHDKDITFVWYYLSKIFPNLNKKTIKMFTSYVMPISLISISFLLQTFMGYIPLINI